jgi:hypothetical protein
VSNVPNKNSGNGILSQGAIFLALTFFALFTLKITLSDCNVFFSGDCEEIKNISQELKNEISLLEQKIKDLKQTTEKLECPPIIQTSSKEQIEKIDQPLWSEGNIEVLDGCWALDWEYKMRRVNTGEVVGVNKWSVCFDKDSETGQQTLIFDDGTECNNQPIEAKFDVTTDQTILLLDDKADVACSNGSSIYRRQLRCELAQDSSHAMCDSNSLQRDGSWSDVQKDTVRLRRDLR